MKLDLVLRNNITTEEHPLGVYHPHAKLHHIKKENIGLIEVMGLAVLPARLKDEMADLEQAILDGVDIRADEKLAKHADWVEEFLPKYGFTAGSGLEGEITPERLHEIVQTEIGLVFKGGSHRRRSLQVHGRGQSSLHALCGYGERMK